ncbi:MAG: PDZ domain-containing protein [Crenarchaeota archaeon]|nr:PDZ domain-containing protein [Thermoproteota archaeon]
MITWIVAWMIAWSMAATLLYIVQRRRGSTEESRLVFYPAIVFVRLARLPERLEKLYGSRLLRIVFDIGVIAMLLSLGQFYMITVQGLVRRLVAPATAVPAFQPILPGVTIGIETFLAMIPSIPIAVAVHEFAHAVAMYVDGVRAKFTGIFLALGVIGGAFVEPDEESLEKASLPARLRIYSAGVAANALTALLAAALLAHLAAPLAVMIVGIQPGSPAAKAGLQPGDIILQVDGKPIHTIEDLHEALVKTPLHNGKRCNDILVQRGKEKIVIHVCRERGQKYIGVYVKQIPYNLVQQYGLKEAEYIYNVVLWFFILNASLAILNAAPLFITDGAKFIHDILVKYLGEAGEYISTAIQFATLVLLLLNLRLPI